MAMNKTVKAAVAALVAATPEGWQVEQGKGGIGLDGQPASWAGSSSGWVRFTTALDTGQKVQVALQVDPIRRGSRPWVLERAFSGASVEGHTILDGASFTRRGIDCSSCGLCDSAEHHDRDTHGSLLVLLLSQLERCRRSVAATRTAEPVPGLPFHRQPGWFETAKAALQAGRSVDLTPHGFGTGYQLSPRAGRYGGSKRADRALETRLGVSPVYVSTFDYD